MSECVRPCLAPQKQYVGTERGRYLGGQIEVGKVELDAADVLAGRGPDDLVQHVQLRLHGRLQRRVLGRVLVLDEGRERREETRRLLQHFLVRIRPLTGQRAVRVRALDVFSDGQRVHHRLALVHQARELALVLFLQPVGLGVRQRRDDLVRDALLQKHQLDKLREGAVTNLLAVFVALAVQLNVLGEGRGHGEHVRKVSS